MEQEVDHLRCDACSVETGGDASLVLVIEAEERVRRVRGVRVACGSTCLPTTTAHDAHELMIVQLSDVGDVFDYADRVIPAHDWERGTIRRLSQVLTVLHRRRRDGA